MRILVLGGEGMLGHKMFQVLRQSNPETYCSLRGASTNPLYQNVPLYDSEKVWYQVDVLDWEAVAGRLCELRPDYVVNCVGIIKQRVAAHDAIPSIAINALFPHKLAALAQEWGGRLIHFSTDCVFDGKSGSYTEESDSNATDLYGRTKLLGEVATENALTLRTSIIGRELSEFQSLLEWFLGQSGGRIKGFRRVIYAGVTTNHMAGLVGKLITEEKRLSGLYQVTSPPIDKYDLLCRLRAAFGLDVEITPDDDVVSDRSMIGEKFIAATGYAMPTWSQLIEQLAADSTHYEDWRRRNNE